MTWMRRRYGPEGPGNCGTARAARGGSALAGRGLRAARHGVGALAASAIFMIGAGLGAAAALTTSPAGASTAHSSLPPVNVSVSNTPTVSVGNLPINSAGRVQVQNESATSYETFIGPFTSVPQNQWYTEVNVSGAGKLTGIRFANAANGQGNCNYQGDTLIQVIADGNMAFRSWVSRATYWGNESSSVFGGANPCTGYGPWFSMHYWPPQGIQFEHSLKVISNSSGNGNGPMQIWAEVFYTVQEAR